METRSTLQKTGKIRRLAGSLALAAFASLAACWGLGAPQARAQDEGRFTAEVDRVEIRADESVSLKLKMEFDGAANAGTPAFTAPDFDVINEYSSVFVNSYYENGRFGMRNTRQLTKVLRPSRTGDLKISGIQVQAGGKTYRASDLTVKVLPAGAGTPAPKGHGGTGVGLRGAGKHANARNVLLRAEIDRARLFKGEQLVVSYYLYNRVRVFNIQVDKFPTLNGFLREELAMPVAGTRLESDRVVLDGVPYERSLLVRYAAYPLQEGKLKIDPLAIKYAYYVNSSPSGLSEDDDPFLQFFQQLAPRNARDQSETITVEVEPLPEEGRPASFSGGVGDFTVVSAVDKQELRANEAVMLTVKVEGRGNVAAIGEPRAKWPDNVELYDSKGRAKTGKGGVGEKIFEFLLIPRAPGSLVLPPIEFSFFDPVQKTYVTRTTEPVTLTVQEPAPGTAANTPAQPRQSPAAGKTDAPAPKPQELRYLMPPDRQSPVAGHPAWRWLYWLTLAVLGVFTLIVLYDLAHRSKASAEALLQAKAKAQARGWDRMRALAAEAGSGGSWQDVLLGYELLTNAVFETLDRVHGVGARALPRAELRQALVDERGMPEILWERMEKLLEFAETVRFATSAGAVTEDAARRELAHWVEEAASVTRVLEQKRKD